MTTKHNQDLINLVKLVEGKEIKFAGEPEQQPGDQVRGTDVAKTHGTDHPFKGRLVGEDTTLEDVLNKKYQDYKDIQSKNKDVEEAGSPAQQAAIAIAMKKAGKKPKSENVAEDLSDDVGNIYALHPDEDEGESVAILIKGVDLNEFDDLWTALPMDYLNQFGGDLPLWDSEDLALYPNIKVKAMTFDQYVDLVGNYIRSDDIANTALSKMKKGVAEGSKPTKKEYNTRIDQSKKDIEDMRKQGTFGPAGSLKDVEWVKTKGVADERKRRLQATKDFNRSKSSGMMEQGVAEADKHSIVGKIQRGHELKKKVDSTWKDIGDAQKAGDKAAGSKAFRKHERYANLERPGTWTKTDEQGVTEGLVGDVVVHNYTKMPIDLKPGQAQIHGWGPVDQPIYRVKGQDGKEVITSNKKKMMMIAQGQGVAEGLPSSLSQSDYTPGQTKKHTSTNCTTCHGRKSMYKLDGKLFADNKPGSVKIKCPTCKGTGDKQGVAEAGPFSYGAKKPRKGSVADLADKKRREQERGKAPIEPRDQRVGTAKVTKGVAEEQEIGKISNGINQAVKNRLIKKLLSRNPELERNYLELATVEELRQMLSDLAEGRSCRMKEEVPQPTTKPTPAGVTAQTNQPPAKPGQPTAGSVSPDEQKALDKIATNPAMKQQFDKLMGQAQPAKPAGPMTLDPEQEAALEKLKANAGLKTQYDKLIKQANPAA